MKQTADDLRAALALIPDRAHWKQCGNGVGSSGSGSTICRCAWVAIVDAIEHHRLPDEGQIARKDRAQKAFMRAAGLSTTHSSALWDWNDAPHRTYADVRAAFEKAITTEEAVP